MSVIKGICKAIDTVNDYLGRVFSVLVLGILGVILIEVFMRRLLSRPQIWTQELMIAIFACYIVLICAYGFQKKAFVAVDVFFNMLPKAYQYLLHMITYILFLVPMIVMIIPRTWNFFLKAYTTGEKSYSVWAEPTWPVKLCFFVGFLLLGIQSVSEILKQLIGFVETLQEEKASPADKKEVRK